MDNKIALLLNNCSINEYLTIFSDKPTALAIEVNIELQEIMLLELKGLYNNKIEVLFELIKKETLYNNAKLLEIQGVINEVESKFERVDLESYNDYLIDIFRINELPINKNLSMLDFYNLEQKAKNITKKANNQ
jgi:hypothetical protein